MSAVSPRQPSGGARKLMQRRRVIGIIGVILFVCLFVVLVLNTLGIFHDPWSKIVAAILGVLGLIFNSPLVQDILKSISSLAINTFSKPKDATVQAPSAAQQITPSPTVIKSCIKREPMPIDPRIIPRQTIVEAIFEQLMHEDINAIILTGLDGIGKTTLATLIFQYAENQRRAHKPVLATSDICSGNWPVWHDGERRFSTAVLTGRNIRWPKGQFHLPDSPFPMARNSMERPREPLPLALSERKSPSCKQKGAFWQ